MKLLRITVLILFLLALTVFIGFKGYEAETRDVSGPEITCNSDSISVSVKASQKELLDGVTAIDNKDGDVSTSLIVEEMSKFKDKGKRSVTYAAMDSSNNVSTFERELVYTDYSTPRFFLSKPLRFEVGNDNIIQDMTARDCIDGDLTDKIKYEVSEYDFGQSEGSYHIKFQVTNSAGDTAYLPADVEFYYPGNKEVIPEIQLSDYIIYIKAGDPVDTRSYLKGVTIGNRKYFFPYGMSKDDIKISSNVNSNVPGVYRIKYSMTTEDGYTGSTELIVVVEE